jgi:hypothetical protein
LNDFGLSTTPDIAAQVGSPPSLHDEIRRLAVMLKGEPLGQKERQLCRYLLMRLSLEAGLQGQADWQQLALDTALAPGFRVPGDWIATPGALEILPSDGGSWSYACSASAEEIDPAIIRTLMGLNARDVGPDLEEKFRISGVTSADGVLNVRLSPTTWQLGRSFHRSVLDEPRTFMRINGRHPVPVPLGEAQLPGLAVVHCIVLTSDRQILLSQRSNIVAYAPLHWSASYEEQVTTEDLQGSPESVFHRCAQRGFLEEFGIDVPLSQIHLLSMLIQMDNLNLGAVMLIEIRDTLDEVRKRWLTDPRPSHAWEAHALAGLEADPDLLRRLSRGEAIGAWAFHATLRLRLAIAATWLNGRQR